MPVTDQTPDVILYDSNGVELAVANGVATPVGTRGLIIAGTDGTTTRFISTDTTGRQVAVGAAASGAAVSGNPVLVAGSDGTNARTLLTDSTGKLVIGTTGSVDTTATGALNALNATVQIALAGQAGAAMQLVAGTLIGTIVPEISFDGGTTWIATSFYDTSGGKYLRIVFAANNTAQARSFFSISGASHVRVRVSAFTSGTATADLRASVAADLAADSHTNPTWSAIAPSIAPANNKSMISILNATGTAVVIRLRELFIDNVQVVANVGIAGLWEVHRITGHSVGTLITPQGYDTVDVLDANVTVRTGSTVAGETAGVLVRKWWSSDNNQGPENSGATDHAQQALRPAWRRNDLTEKPFTLRSGEGITVKFATASGVGTFDVTLVFTQEAA